MALNDIPAVSDAGSTEHDVVIVGASFAGLAVARQLRGRRVLLVDQRPVGTHQTSTCAMPLSLVAMLGVESAVQERHDTLNLHTGGKMVTFKLHEPYVTFDYYAFCQAMLAQTDAEVWLAKATGYENGVVQTTRGEVRAPFVVDASGWRSLVRQSPSREIPMLGYGVETELPVRAPLHPGLHFFYEKKIVRSGYGWVFPCGESVRIGVCSFDKDVPLGPVLDAFLARFGLERGTTHGGPMPVALRQPLAGDLFIVGDACGQCMPLFAEGIRSAIYYSVACGQGIAEALDGRISPVDARTRYAALVGRKAYFHEIMLRLQGAIAAMPERMRVPILRVASWPPISRHFIGAYLRGSGWLRSLPTLPPVQQQSFTLDT